MKQVRLDAAVRAQLREIRTYSNERWGRERADRYIRELSAKFDDIASGRVHPRRVPSSTIIEGYVCSYKSHFIYWRLLGDDAVAIVAVLHQSMQQSDRLGDAFGKDD